VTRFLALVLLAVLALPALAADPDSLDAPLT